MAECAGKTGEERCRGRRGLTSLAVEAVDRTIDDEATQTRS